MSAETKILIVEHNESDIELLHYELKSGGISYISEIVENEKDYCHSLKKFMPDIILSDYRLPQFDGPSAFIMKGKLAPDTPFIFVSGTIGEENSIEYIKNGLTDYVLKDTLFTLPSKVKRALKESKDKRHKDKTDKELVQSERRLSRAQQLGHMGSWELDFSTDTFLLSDEACRIFDSAADSNNRLSFENWASLLHPDDADVVLKLIRKSRDTLTDTSYSHRIVLKDKTVKYIYSESKFEFDSDNKAIALYGIAQDVTQTKLAEKERLKIVNELMQRNKDLEQFAYIVSHNLRAPVANILGATKGMNYSALSTEIKDKLSQGLSDSVTKIDEILKDLNHILEVKREITETKKIVLFSVIMEEIKMSVKSLIGDNKIEIKYDFSEINQMLTLKTYLHSIFYHLISNSIKYRQQKIPAIIQIKSHDNEDKVELIFTDNGMGIDLKARGGQIFGLYKRFHANIEGKGMGLFMVKAQVETLGGKISVKSKVNKGTEFKIEFDK